MGVKKQIDMMYSYVNWNYLGLAAGILSIIVTMYNISKYYEDIKKTESE